MNQLAHTRRGINVNTALAAGPARFAVGWALLLGAVFGLLLYLINFYGFTAIWPWFENARNWVSVVSHLIYGVILAAMIGRSVRLS